MNKVQWSPSPSVSNTCISSYELCLAVDLDLQSVGAVANEINRESRSYDGRAPVSTRIAFHR
jgi:hypothetical protein